MKTYSIVGKKGLEMHTVIVSLILGLILILALVPIFTGKTQSITTYVRSIVDTVFGSWKNLIGEETEEDKLQRTEEDQQLLDFSQQLTSQLDACLRAKYTRPCLCFLKDLQLFPEKYTLILFQRGDKHIYFSRPAAIRENGGPRFLENNPRKQTFPQEFTLCLSQPQNQLVSSLYFFTQDSQFYAQLTGINSKRYLLELPFVFYRPNDRELCLLPPIDSLFLASFTDLQHYETLRSLSSCSNNNS